MKIRGGTIVAILLALVVAGCGLGLEKAQSVTPSGDAFSSSLHYYYTQFAAHEQGEGDYRAADIMADKAIAAAGGEAVLPSEVVASELPGAKVGELAEARRVLLETLDGGGRKALPDSAANAQVKFECWLHEAEEDFEHEETEGCKNDFWAALNAVQQAMLPEPVAPAPAPAPAPAEPAVFLVYFDFDHSDLRDDQQAVLDVIIAASNAAPERAIHVVAHTDTSGAIDYNQALSERRKNTILGGLIEGSVARGRISSEAVGETQPLVDTGDGVREQGNRVAVVTLY